MAWTSRRADFEGLQSYLLRRWDIGCQRGPSTKPTPEVLVEIIDVIIYQDPPVGVPCLEAERPVVWGSPARTPRGSEGPGRIGFRPFPPVPATGVDDQPSDPLLRPRGRKVFWRLWTFRPVAITSAAMSPGTIGGT